MTQAEFPVEGVALTHLLVVSDMEQSRHFYRDVLGATVYREYGGTSCVLNSSRRSVSAAKPASIVGCNA